MILNKKQDRRERTLSYLTCYLEDGIKVNKDGSKQPLNKKEELRISQEIALLNYYLKGGKK